MRAISAIRWILVGLIVLVLAVPALAVTLGGRLIVEVDGESMTPTYQVGDILLVREPAAEDLSVGDVVTAVDGNGDFYTHRIIAVNGDGTVSLKGDGNTAADPGTVAFGNIRGMVELHLGQPWAFAVIELQQWPLRICLLAVILGLALIPLGSPKGAAAVAPAPVGPSPRRTDGDDPASRRGRRRAPAAAKRKRSPGRRREHVATTGERSASRRAARPVPGTEQPIRFRSSFSKADPVSSVEQSTGPALPVAHPVESPKPLSSLDAAVFSPVIAASIAGGDVRRATAIAPALETIDDDVDAVDDIANVVVDSALPAGGHGYSITVIDGADGQPRVRISVDLDPSALAAALAVAAPQPPAVPHGTAPGGARFTAISAAREHVTSGITPPIDFDRERGRRSRSRHGRRRAS